DREAIAHDGLSLLCSLSLPQRIVFDADKIGGAISCRGMRTPTLGEGKLFHARASQQPRKTIVSFDAARLGIKPVIRVAQLDEILLGGPWACPHRRIVDRNRVFKCIRTGPRPALDQMQVLAGALIIGLRAEVRHVDHEGTAFPMPARVAVPLADTGRQMGTSVHDDVALPALALANVVEDRNAARGLHDPAEAAGRGPKLRQPEG